MWEWLYGVIFCQAEDGIRDLVRSRGLGDVYKRQTNTTDAYQQSEPSAPATLTRTNPTMTVEAWVFSERALPEEQTIVAWGHRGGPEGTNMSFNYGTHPVWGAAGHWGWTDLGWYRSGAAGAPVPGQWHHLVYTFDGTHQRVFADGAETNSENIAGALNLWPLPKITLACQLINNTDIGDTHLSLIHISEPTRPY